MNVPSMSLPTIFLCRLAKPSELPFLVMIAPRTSVVVVTVVLNEVGDPFGKGFERIG